MNIYSVQQNQTQTNEEPGLHLWISMDMYLGQCLDDFLFKLHGTDQLVWIPQEAVNTSPKEDNRYLITLQRKSMYCCARINISNTIRMCLVDQHRVSGTDLLNYMQSPVWSA
ncbi:hypothetical protein ACFODZ_07860 [Marinicella sediminis]|uniref:Uncharacterized protein n=1 Tax=Marinicella sediminis TaxID=1792834 RepID=A0ABV7JD54_9GAMM|nr:hypothetical protein [Marinicella sediminis]